MALLLNIITNNDTKDNEKQNDEFHYSGSGFSFEFKDKEQGKAQVLRKKTLSKVERTKASSSDFKLINEKSPTAQSKIRKKEEDKPSVVPAEVLEFPKALPVFDFVDDESKKSKKKKKKNANPEIRDYVKEAQKMPEPPKERKKVPKAKFSKVSNPFPNDPSKKVQKQESKQQKGEDKKMAGSKLSAEEEVQSKNSSVFTVESVDSLKIHPHSIKNMKEVLNFHKLTHVQQKSLPPALDGKDLLIRSATGSGKTLTYALPIVERLQRIQPKLNRSQGLHALVIVPTRELCVQTYELFVKLVKPFTWLVPGYLSGGEKRKSEKARLKNGITILISTPGRLCDHLMHTESLKLDKVEIFVLDEADRLLELGYENDVKKVVDTISAHSEKGNKAIQTILLSATLTAKVKQLAGLTLESPVCVDNENVETIKDMLENDELDENITIPSGIEQTYFMIPPKLRFAVLCSLLVQKISSGARKILIFFPTQHVVDYHYDILVEFLTQPFTRKPKTAQSYLNNADESDEDIHEMLNEQESDEDESEENIWLPHVTLFKLFGSMTQIERVSVFREFKACKSGILLCTDVAARGLDVPQLDLVIQYSAPQELCNYYHRIGRTARAGAKGSAIIFLTRNEEKFIELLKSKNVEINENDYTKSLREVKLPNLDIRVYEEKIVKLQRKLEDLLNDDEELRMKASRAFTSWICYYKTFSKELRHMFNLREIHMGHLANNFGLRDAPKAIVKQHSQTDEVKKERNKNFDFIHRVHVPRGDQSSINRLKRKYGDFSKTNFGKVSKISEFDSGLEVKKKRK